MPAARVQHLCYPLPLSPGQDLFLIKSMAKVMDVASITVTLYCHSNIASRRSVVCIDEVGSTVLSCSMKRTTCQGTEANCPTASVNPANSLNELKSGPFPSGAFG